VGVWSEPPVDGCEPAAEAAAAPRLASFGPPTVAPVAEAAAAPRLASFGPPIEFVTAGRTEDDELSLLLDPTMIDAVAITARNSRRAASHTDRREATGTRIEAVGLVMRTPFESFS
jgi:hypothetical protein